MPPTRPDTSETSERLSGRVALAQAASQLASLARRDIALLSRDLPIWVYATPPFVEAVKQHILSSQHARVRLLVQHTGHAARGHRLVELSRHLSSFCEIRTPTEADREIASDWLIIDQHHILERPNPDAPTARRWSNAPRTARNYLHRFNAIWAQAEPATELRRLYLS